MPRFSANLGFLWPDRPLIARIEAAAAAGFGAIELHWPYEIPPEAIRAECAARGVILLGINVPRGELPGDFGLGCVPGREAEFRAGFERAADYARAAGAGALHVLAGKARGARAAEVLEANLVWAAGRAPDLTLLLEPMNRVDQPGYFYATAQEAAGVIARVGARTVGLMFDAYHIGRSGADVIAELTTALPLIRHVQIAAVPSRAEPDEGDLDYGAVFAALDRLGYAGWVGCEYQPRGDTDAGLGWRSGLAG